MAIIPQPNVPEPVMPWAREITKIINSLIGDNARIRTGAAALNQQIGSSTTAIGVTAIATDVAQVTADDAAIAATEAAAAALVAQQIADQAALDAAAAAAAAAAITIQQNAAEADLVQLQTDLTALDTELTTAQGELVSLDSSMTTLSSTLTTAQGDINSVETAVATAQSAATAAASAASAAQTTANGRNRVYYQDAAPSTVGNVVNDMWFDTNDGHKMYKWSGSAWVATQFGTTAIGSNAITATNILGGAVDSTKLATAINTSISNAASAAATADGKAVIADGKAVDAQGTADLVTTVTNNWKKAGQTTIDGGKIATDSITSVQIAARTITAQQLVLADFTNMAPDPLLEFGTSHWPTATIVAVTGAIGALNAIRLTSTGTGYPSTYSSDYIPVNPGQSFYFTAEAYKPDAAGSATMRLRWTDKNKVVILMNGSSSAPAAWGTISGTATAPANAAFVTVWFEYGLGTTGQQAFFTNFSLRLRNNADLIVDGAITTNKMTAGSIDGDRITANTLDANRIVAGSITSASGVIGALDAGAITTGYLAAARINAGTITAAMIAGKIITASQIAADAITATELAANSVVTDSMAANTINGDRVLANTLNANKIVAGSITTDRMTANSIAGDRITAGTLAADKLVANTISATQLTVGVTNSITAAQGAADLALGDAAAAQALAEAATLSDTFTINPTFAKWSGALPDLYTLFGANTIVKETGIKRTGAHALRFNVTTSDTGIQFGSSLNPNAAYSEYITVTVDAYLVSGTFGQAGVILDWTGMTPNRSLLNLATEIPAPQLGKWYRVTKVIRRPTTATGTFSNYTGYLMGQWSGHTGGATAKNIVFDRFSIRASTAEEISAVNTAAEVIIVDAKAVSKARTFAQTAAPTGMVSTDAGDIWIDTDDKNKMYRWSGTAWTAYQDGTIADARTVANTVTTLTDSWKSSGFTTINGGMITTDSILAGAIAADAITVKHTLTGAKLRTAASGQRVEIDSTGLKGYAADGTTVKSSISTAGILTAVDAIITGTIKSAASGQRVEISSTSAKFFAPNGTSASVVAINNGAANGSDLQLNGGLGTALVGWFARGGISGGSSEFLTDSATITNISADSIHDVSSIQDDLGRYYSIGTQLVADSGARLLLFPVLTQGLKCFRRDTGQVETYYELYSATTNKAGRSAAGWSADPCYSEFTTTANGLVNNTLYHAGTVANVPASSNDVAFAVGGTSGVLTLRDPGVYAINWRAGIGGAVTGRTFLAILVGGVEVARTSISTGEDASSIAIPAVRTTAANTNVTFQVYKATSGNSNVVGRVHISRVS